MKINWIDRAICSVSPESGLKRLRSKAAAGALANYMNNSGYAVPGNPKRAMKGFNATANSPDDDINTKLSGMRAASRDLFMNSPLASAILRRRKGTSISYGLIPQSRVDRKTLGIDEKAAEEWENRAEREFALAAESMSLDYDGKFTFGELQGVALLNMMLSGDCWMVLPFEENKDPYNPYSTRVKLIDADLVRDPANKGTTDIQGGVERDTSGRDVAIHVWNCYENEYSTSKTKSSVRIPLFNENGKRQVHHIANLERLNQRRGVCLLASAVEPLKQLTRLSEAQLMNALVSAFLTVIVKDNSGNGITLGNTMISPDGVFGAPPVNPSAAAENKVFDDIELGFGNVAYIDGQTDITTVDPRKVDTGYAAFALALENNVTAVGGVSLEQVKMLYNTSYTAARAALDDVWRIANEDRTLIERRMLNIVYGAILEEGITRGRLSAPRFFDDPIYRKAWMGVFWVGVGRGSLDPYKEARAAQLNLRIRNSTHEEEYAARTGGRWDDAMRKLSSEERLLVELGLTANLEDVDERTAGDSSGEGEGEE